MNNFLFLVMKGIKFQIEKLSVEIDELLLKPAKQNTRQIHDINFYKFSGEALHLSYLLFQQCDEIDSGLRRIYFQMSKKMKQAMKIRPQVQSDDQQQNYQRDQIASFLNYRRPLPDTKERGNLEHVLNQLQNKEKETANFLQGFDHIKLENKQKKIAKQVLEKQVQTQIKWVHNRPTFEEGSLVDLNEFQPYVLEDKDNKDQELKKRRREQYEKVKEDLMDKKLKGGEKKLKKENQKRQKTYGNEDSESEKEYKNTQNLKKKKEVKKLRKLTQVRPIREEKEKSARVKEKYYKNEDRIREGDSVKNKNNRNMKMNGNANNNVNKNEGKQFREQLSQNYFDEQETSSIENIKMRSKDKRENSQLKNNDKNKRYAEGRQRKLQQLRQNNEGYGYVRGKQKGMKSLGNGGRQGLTDMKQQNNNDGPSQFTQRSQQFSKYRNNHQNKLNSGLKDSKKRNKFNTYHNQHSQEQRHISKYNSNHDQHYDKNQNNTIQDSIYNKLSTDEIYLLQQEQQKRDSFYKYHSTHQQPQHTYNNENLPTVSKNNIHHMNTNQNKVNVNGHYSIHHDHHPKANNYHNPYHQHHLNNRTLENQDQIENDKEIMIMKMLDKENLSKQEVEEKQKIILDELQRLKKQHSETNVYNSKRIGVFIRLMERIHEKTCKQECKHLKKFYKYLKNTSLYSFRKALLLPITRISFNR